MKTGSCTLGTRGSRRKRSTNEKTSSEILTKPRRNSRHERTQLIERSRQLMEKTIEFVDHPWFGKSNCHQKIQSIRPDSIDVTQAFRPASPGIAFVSGMVQSPLLTPEEERYWFTRMNFLKWRAEQNRRKLDLGIPDLSLAERIESDLNEAVQVRNRIVQGNLRLIVALARKLAGSIELMSDLISEGMAPLIRSVELFDISLGNRFSTYATWAVRNQMLRSLKRTRTSREVTTGEDTPSLENLPDKCATSELSESFLHFRLDTVNRLLSTLSERERIVITARFGLEGQPQGQSLAAIAQQVRLSKERVRQIVLTSLSKLRDELSAEEIEIVTGNQM